MYTLAKERFSNVAHGLAERIKAPIRNVGRAALPILLAGGLAVSAAAKNLPQFGYTAPLTHRTTISSTNTGETAASKTFECPSPVFKLIPAVGWNQLTMGFAQLSISYAPANVNNLELYVYGQVNTDKILNVANIPSPIVFSQYGAMSGAGIGLKVLSTERELGPQGIGLDACVGILLFDGGGYALTASVGVTAEYPLSVWFAKLFGASLPDIVPNLLGKPIPFDGGITFPIPLGTRD